MKLVSFDDFIRMPAGTIFAPYTPCVIEEGLAIKTDTGREFHDRWADKEIWIFNGVMKLEPWLGDFIGLYDIGDQNEASFEIYDGDNNDYSHYKMFLVFEEADIDRMIDVLKWAKAGCTGDYKLSKDD